MICTPEAFMESSRVWSAKRDTPGRWFGNPRTPVGVRGEGLPDPRGCALRA